MKARFYVWIVAAFVLLLCGAAYGQGKPGLAVYVRGGGNAVINKVISVPIEGVFKASGKFQSENQKTLIGKLGKSADDGTISNLAMENGVRFVCIIDVSNVKVKLPANLSGSATISLLDAAKGKTLGAPQTLAMPPTNITEVGKALLTLAISTAAEATVDAIVSGGSKSGGASTDYGPATSTKATSSSSKTASAPAPAPAASASGSMSGYVPQSAQYSTAPAAPPPAPVAAYQKPRLAMRPFAGSSDGDDATIITLLSKDSALSNAFVIVPGVDAAVSEYMFMGSVSNMDGRDLFSASVIHSKSSNLVAGGYRLHRNIEDIKAAIPYMAGQMAASAKRSNLKMPGLVIAPFVEVSPPKAAEPVSDGQPTQAVGEQGAVVPPVAGQPEQQVQAVQLPQAAEQQGGAEQAQAEGQSSEGETPQAAVQKPSGESETLLALSRMLHIDMANTGKFAVMPPRTSAVRAALDELEALNPDVTQSEKAKAIGTSMNADYVLFVTAHGAQGTGAADPSSATDGAAAILTTNLNMLDMRIYETKGGNMIFADTLNYSTLEDGSVQMPRSAARLAKNVPDPEPVAPPPAPQYAGRGVEDVMADGRAYFADQQAPQTVGGERHSYAGDGDDEGGTSGTKVGLRFAMNMSWANIDVFRYNSNSYYGYERQSNEAGFGWEIGMPIHSTISPRWAFIYGFNLNFRTTVNTDYYRVDEAALTIPLIFRVGAKGDVGLFFEQGFQMDIPLMVEDDRGDDVPGRSGFDFGYVSGVGLYLGRHFELHTRYIVGTSDFTNRQSGRLDQYCYLGMTILFKAR